MGLTGLDGNEKMLAALPVQNASTKSYKGSQEATLARAPRAAVEMVWHWQALPLSRVVLLELWGLFRAQPAGVAGQSGGRL